ncbi:type II secretion system minor pseudopilin GspI [Enterobacter sp. PI-10]|uniref:type II secretion system minor pseudopilin GspI n=1 Tax=Enterobacter sp. PI-10 TaxID=2899140 RepID=UPI0023015728|nr:type II secretion system minor pseudopilin GspI [Enterobacter sp. PI-10]MDA5603346.1 type II secretion system minor pseudopilin GspI [Enterobacter sp. PI-10]
MTKRKTKDQGMTLLEVMVAMVIFSTAALALMNSVTLNVRFTHSLSETLQAGWVAENQLAQAQLAQTDFPDAEQVGTETMGGQTWTWHIQRVKTDENTFADEVRVYSEGSDAQPVVALQLDEPEVDRE